MSIIARGSIVDWEDITLNDGAVMSLGGGMYNLTNFIIGPGSRVILVHFSSYLN